MTFSTFQTLIEKLEKLRDRGSSLYENGVDLISYDETPQEVISLLLNSVFSKEACGWIEWYIYERPSFSGNILAASHNGVPICFDIPSLWEEVRSSQTNPQESEIPNP